MTNNIDRATEVIGEAYQEAMDSGTPSTWRYQIARRLANAGLLAADRLEYRVEHKHIDNGFWHPVTRWSPEWPLREGHTVAPDERIMCRWEVTDE